MPENAIIAIIGLVVIIPSMLWCYIRHIRSLVPRPDPWDDQIQAALDDDSATPVCHRCLNEHSATDWFCPHCGAAVGEYNNWLPYVQIFSEGEVLRNAVFDRIRVNSMVVIGFVLFTLALAITTGLGIVLAPIYLVLFLRNVGRSRAAVAEEKISNANETPI